MKSPIYQQIHEIIRLIPVRQTLTENPKAKTIITGNPGCLYQIRAGIRSENIDLRILHPAVYLAERLNKLGTRDIPQIPI